MATATESLPDELIEDQEAPAGRKRLIKRLLVVVAVLAIVIVECLVAYCYLPSGGKTAELAEHAHAAPPPVVKLPPPSHSHDEHGHEDGEALTHDLVEVELGEYTITSFQPASGMTVRIECSVFCTVPGTDEPEFRQLLEHRGNRVRDNVIVTIRSADMTDLTDARLALIKRTILETTNRTLGKPLIESVLFGEFMFMEQ